jgi:hypothetical protein
MADYPYAHPSMPGAPRDDIRFPAHVTASPAQPPLWLQVQANAEDH